ncbi:hypothetical protein SLEP1_g37507 [Rubroshorea leprosula]|uniref:Uncharacterized protein n=1 Tax=Rubroshorea leprosula TaxID=152421 RepID=A0AAV5KVP0_9ROSI|nr:hypothetical protein SLEP1_g37507 [Rubroshorea leprosula]
MNQKLEDLFLSQVLMVELGSSSMGKTEGLSILSDG